MSNSPVEQVLAGIDAANAEDPTHVEVDGEGIPAELAYGHRMSEWLATLRPDAPEPLQIAARAQHIRRWEIPRSDFPEGRVGYHQWRTTLYGFHGDAAADIMRAAGYDEDAIDRVKFILTKKQLKSDPDVQTLEDAAALVFLEHHFAAFAARDDMTDEKLIGVLQKTWAKMSPQGQEAAAGVALPPQLAELVQRALAGD